MTTTTDAALIVATLAGPVLAVQAQKFIERVTERKQAQRRVFYTLMATRATRVSPAHVEALNAIELEFCGYGWRGPTAKEREVLARWRVYSDHLDINIEKSTEAQLTAWSVTREELFTDLLEALAEAMGYTYDRVQLKRSIYWPRAHGEAEFQQKLMQKGLLEVLTGQQPLAMKVTDFPISEEALELQMEYQKAFLRMVGPDGRLEVRVVQDRAQPPFAEAAE